MSQISMHTPIGDLTISIANEALVSIDWGWARDQRPIKLLEDAKSQLDDYFDGYRKTFDLPLAPPGTEYQRRVWSQMYKIPYGKTLSYGKIASILKSSARAVGMACGANPIPIVVLSEACVDNVLNCVAATASPSLYTTSFTKW